MDWKVAMDRERAALCRIVALLHALADLAEIAAGRPGVRGLVLWFLRHAEATARAFVAGQLHVPHTELTIVPAGASPEDAMRLAAGLRALARQIDRQVGFVLAMCWRHCGESGSRPFDRMPATRAALDAIAALACAVSHHAQAPDTS